MQHENWRRVHPHVGSLHTVRRARHSRRLKHARGPPALYGALLTIHIRFHGIHGTGRQVEMHTTTRGSWRPSWAAIYYQGRNRKYLDDVMHPKDPSEWPRT